MNNDRTDTITKRRTPAHPPSPPGIQQAALVAGVGLLAMAVLAGFGNLVVMEGLVTPGDAAKTAADIAASEGLFRLGVGSLYLVVVLDVVVAWALMRVFSAVHPDLARLGAWFRLAYAVVFLVAISQLAGVPGLLDPSGYATTVMPAQVQGQVLLKVDTFTNIWFAGLVLFGVHLTVVDYLACRSGFVPRLLGVLLVISGAGYIVDSFVRVFTESAPFTVSNVTFLGEFLLALWLVRYSRSPR